MLWLIIRNVVDIWILPKTARKGKIEEGRSWDCGMERVHKVLETVGNGGNKNHGKCNPRVGNRSWSGEENERDGFFKQPNYEWLY